MKKTFIILSTLALVAFSCTGKPNQDPPVVTCETPLEINAGHVSGTWNLVYMDCGACAPPGWVLPEQPEELILNPDLTYTRKTNGNITQTGTFATGPDNIYFDGDTLFPCFIIVCEENLILWSGFEMGVFDGGASYYSKAD